MDDAVSSFLKIVGWLLVPLIFALLGLVLLTSLVTGVIWFVAIFVFVLLYIRFSDRHKEHLEYDDKLNHERWEGGREKYFKLLEEDEKKNKSKG